MTCIVSICIFVPKRFDPKKGKMKTIHIIGSSHGKRLAMALERLPEYGKSYHLKNYAKGGACFKDLVWPDPDDLGSEDVLIVIPFGNDLLQKNKNCIFRGSDKILHMQKFLPTPDNEFLNLYNLLGIKLLGYLENKVFVIQNFYRHFCCEKEKHHHRGWLGYQNRRNNELKKELEPFSCYVVVLDHRKLHTRSGQLIKDILMYKSKQYDGVHFRDYSVIGKNVLRFIL